jgi:hypothetical protein
MAAKQCAEFRVLSFSAPESWKVYSHCPNELKVYEFVLVMLTSLVFLFSLHVDRYSPVLLCNYRMLPTDQLTLPSAEASGCSQSNCPSPIRTFRSLSAGVASMPRASVPSQGGRASDSQKITPLESVGSTVISIDSITSLKLEHSDPRISMDSDPRTSKDSVARISEDSEARLSKDSEARISEDSDSRVSEESNTRNSEGSSLSDDKANGSTTKEFTEAKTEAVTSSNLTTTPDFHIHSVKAKKGVVQQRDKQADPYGVTVNSQSRNETRSAKYAKRHEKTKEQLRAAGLGSKAIAKRNKKSASEVEQVRGTLFAKVYFAS